MLIGIDASRANNLNKTGTEWYSYYLIQAIKKLPDQDQFVLYSREKLRDGLENLPANFQSRILRWPFKLWTQLRLSLEMLIHQPDILFVPAHTMPLIHPKKTITALHDIGFARYPELYTKSELSYHNWAAQYALKKAKMIITISEFSKKEIMEAYKVKENKIKVVYLGYDHEQFRPDLDKEKIRAIKEKYNLTKPYFFYIGRLEKKKNVLGLIKAFNNLENKEVNLFLAGKPGLGYEEVEDYILKNNLQDRIIRPGWISQEQVPYLMAGAEALVMPSFYEGFCLPVLEAMALGTPVIGSNSAAIPEIASGAALLVDPRDINKLTEAMNRIFNNQELKEELREIGIKRAQEFSWDKCAQETLDIIHSL